MSFNKFFALAVFLPSIAFAGPLDPRFFASREFQNQFPGAFALQAESQAFVARSMSMVVAEANTLIQAIGRTPGLTESILRFPGLDEAARLQVMSRIFQLQTGATASRPPQLVLDNAAPRSAFFEFDPQRPGAGKVILNPAKLFKDPNPYSALLLLIHETRHSRQFQIAHSPSPGEGMILSLGYKAAFAAQRQIFDRPLKVSFCDFLTLNNEYEAFLFGNYVMETLTAGAVDTKDMGTWASQYSPGRGLRIHLPDLTMKVGVDKLLDAFNTLEVIQYKEVYGGQTKVR